MSALAPRNGTALRTVVALALMAVSLAGCAGRQPRSGNDPLDGSGSSVPNHIDYQGFPYNLRAG